ncbi:MAG: hypothetical protein OHK0029_19830 [Armatimonadaceae bacterium]
MNRKTFLLGGLGGACVAVGSSLSSLSWAAQANRKILVWSEGTAPKEVYPDDINGAIAKGLAGLRGYTVQTASLPDPEQGLSDAVLNEADVLFWWGHLKHGDIPDATVERIVRRVRDGGMGIVFLHSAHFAKPLKAVLNSSGAWKAYVNDRAAHRIRVADPKHPIARGVRDFTIPQEERYEEPFVVPQPEAVVLTGQHESTQTEARQGICWTVGQGRVFYFRPGHEEFPVFFMPPVRRILRNAALWAAKDEAGIWEDNDPAAKAARATKEPPLALILRDAGYGGTDVTAVGEIAAQRYVRAGSGLVRLTVLAAFGVLQECRGGWYAAETAAKDPITAPKPIELWRIPAPENKRMAPPLAPGSKTAFDPGANKPFGLWVSTAGFAGETIYTEDALQTLVKRFPSNDRHKAHTYAAVRSDGSPVPNAVIIGFEYSTNNDNQEVVLLVENVRQV